LLAILFAGLAAACGRAAEPVVAKLPYDGPLVVGVQTHLGQNWPDAAQRIAKHAPVRQFRDGLGWAAVEKAPGRISFEGTRLPYLRALCADGGRLVLTVVPRNPLYEAGRPVASPEGQEAFVNYVDALLGELPGCVDAVELGNEINAADALKTVDGNPGKDEYVALAGRLKASLDQTHPKVALLAGSTNTVGTGFLESLFARGLLDHADGIAIHPYRGHAEGLGWELDRLTTVMAQHGRVLPIWATEFSDEFDDLADGAPAMIKMLSIMSAEGVQRAYWYALIDQRWFRNMGLYTVQGSAHPSAKALAFAANELLKQGRAVSVSTDPLLRMYRFGSDRWVVWGTPRAIHIDAGTKLFDAEGNAVSTPATLDGSPLIAIGAQPKFGPSTILADTLYQFDSRPWGYYAITADGKRTDLTPLDGQYESSLGSRYLRPFRILDARGALAGTRDAPVSAVLNYAPVGSEKARLRLCVRPSAKGDGVSVKVMQGDRTLLQQDFREAGTFVSDPLELTKNAPMDIIFSPAGTSKQNNTFSYRAQLLVDGPIPAQCENNFVGWTA
jgi:hypothetical protein